jgi:hypothetical protein
MIATRVIPAVLRLTNVIPITVRELLQMRNP